jgi:isopenicillin-N N-acyltransferase-like protein
MGTSPAGRFVSYVNRARLGLVLPALFLGCAAAIAAYQAPAGTDPATTRQLKVLHLSGSPYERGFQHGTRLRTEIAALVLLWKEDLRRSTGTDPDALLRSFLAQTSFTPAISTWTPGLLDEVRGIADGAKQPFETMFAFQLVDELWVFIDKRAAEHCTSLGVARHGARPAYVAQNMDLEPFRDGFQAVLHIAGSASAPEQFVFTSAGLIGVNGVNGRSIAIACNTLMQLAASPEGLPVAFIVRGVLAQTAGEDAVTFVKRVPHASGQNYIVGTRDQVSDFEASAGKVVEFRPAADGSIVYHTNHPVANDDVKPWHRLAMQSMPPDQRGAGNSETRLASIQKRLQRPAEEFDEGVIKAALRSRDSERHPVCRSLKMGSGAFTFGATIMTLSGTPSFQVSMGPPDVNPFVRFEFSGGHGGKSRVPETRKELR